MRSGRGVRSATVTVGREAENDILARALGDARAGRPGCTLLAGEGGVGKSRLLHEAAAAARRAGLGVAAGRAAISAPAPFSLVAEALRSWLRGHPHPPMGSAFDRGLRLILPEWEVPSGGEAGLDGGQLRLLAMEAAVRLLRDVAGPGPGMVLLLDDLHAADPDSLETIRYLAAARIGGLAIMAALRPAESAVADELVRALRGDDVATVVELEPLGLRATGDLVRHLLAAAPPGELVADVLARTDGVPLLVEEVVDAHLRGGSVVVEGGQARWRGGPLALPRSVRGMVAARLDQLPRPGQDALLALAVIGVPEPAGLLPAVAGTEERAVAEALRGGVDAGLLTTSAGVIGFRHAIIREAILDTAVPQIVTAMHRRAADALDGGPAATRRAAHLAAAGDGDAAAGLFAAAAAGELAAHALLGAESLARRAAGLAVAPATRAEAADALAAVLAAQGRWAEALDIDEATVAGIGDSADRRQRMAAAALEAGYPERAAACLARGDGGLPLSRVLAGRVALVRGDAVTALAEADAVLAQRADTGIRLAALDIRARALDYLDQRDAARDAWSAQVQEATAAGRTQDRLRALFQLGKQEFFASSRPARLREAVEVAAGGGCAARAVLGRGDAGHRAYPAGRPGRGPGGPGGRRAAGPRAAPGSARLPARGTGRGAQLHPSGRGGHLRRGRGGGARPRSARLHQPVSGPTSLFSTAAGTRPSRCSASPTRWPPRCPAAPRWTCPATWSGRWPRPAGRTRPGPRSARRRRCPTWPGGIRAR